MPSRTGSGRSSSTKRAIDPSRDRNALVAGLSGRVVLGGARRGFSGRPRGDGADEIPVFFFGRGFGAGVFFVGGLHPVGDGAADDLHGNAAAELIEARARCGRAATRRLVCTLVRPWACDGMACACWSSFVLRSRARARAECGRRSSQPRRSRCEFCVVVAAGDDFNAVAVVERVHRFAHLGDAAPKRDAALADVAVAEGFVFGPQKPGDDANDHEERDRDERAFVSSERDRIAVTGRW